MSNQLRITYKKSTIGRVYRQARVIRALGFTHLGQSRIVQDNTSMRGMIRKVEHLLVIESLPESAVAPEIIEEVPVADIKEEEPREAENN